MHNAPIKGRGSLSNDVSRFDMLQRETFDDGWVNENRPEESRPATTVTHETARSIISRNDSPDLYFDQSINPYRGCEHGCVYCYARPSHAYLGHSPGLDFETRLYAKHNAADVLRKTLSNPSYVPRLIALGANTDPYQPVERRLRITASILDVLDEFNHPVAITTKSASVTQDLDLLARMAARNLVCVHVSVGTLDRHIARTLEPRASTPGARLDAVRTLSDAGIPTGVIVAPVIPSLNDHDLENIIFRAKAEGARSAHYVLLRLPMEIAGLFQEWLAAHHPLKQAHVMNLVRQTRGGKVYDANFQTRMRGAGVVAGLIEQRFRKACQKAGLTQRRVALDVSHFRRPTRGSAQLALF
ncbi:MAG TPA: PA0069 family radical SAM protein [Burkholderiaceae bacterium]|nr:PA0069 family radical SAM protein [Burkholderiaceae bacterium]